MSSGGLDLVAVPYEKLPFTFVIAKARFGSKGPSPSASFHISITPFTPNLWVTFLARLPSRLRLAEWDMKWSSAPDSAFDVVHRDEDATNTAARWLCTTMIPLDGSFSESVRFMVSHERTQDALRFSKKPAEPKFGQGPLSGVRTHVPLLHFLQGSFDRCRQRFRIA